MQQEDWCLAFSSEADFSYVDFLVFKTFEVNATKNVGLSVAVERI